MTVAEAIGIRKSIRNYVKTEIPRKHMEILLRSLQLAPSASNGQNWEFIFVDDSELKKRLIPACFHQRFVGECTYFVAGVVDPALKWHQVDTTIAFTNFTLQATELGYGTCWIGAFREESIKEILGVPQEKKVLICMAFGKPMSQPFPKPRKPIESFVYLNGYKQEIVL